MKGKFFAFVLGIILLCATSAFGTGFLTSEMTKPDINNFFRVSKESRVDFAQLRPFTGDYTKVNEEFKKAKEIYEDEKFNGSDRALRLAAEQLKHQLSEMNNVKATFVPRTEIESALEKIELRIEPLLKSSQIRTGADKWKDYILIVIISLLVSGIVSGLVTILWRKILT